MLEEPLFREQRQREHEELLRFERALTRLPDNQRAVLEMRLLQGLTVAEICDATGLSKLSLAGLLFQAMKALRSLLEERDGGPRPTAPEGAG
jgi:RNA polymerase sigma-70 factor (ECF subfamily)